MAEVECRSKEGDYGFTLLELLVALILLVLLASIASTGLRISIDAWHRRQAGASSIAEVYNVHSAIRRIIEDAQPIIVQSASTAQVTFSGTQTRLDLLVDMPEQFGLGGLYTVTLWLEGAANSQHLSLTTQVYVRDQPTWPPAFGSREPTVLLSNLSSMTFHYYGKIDGSNGPQWHQSWQRQRHLPQLIALRLANPRRGSQPWPSLIAAPLLNERPSS